MLTQIRFIAHFLRKVNESCVFMQVPDPMFVATKNLISRKRERNSLISERIQNQNLVNQLELISNLMWPVQRDHYAKECRKNLQV